MQLDQPNEKPGQPNAQPGQPDAQPGQSNTNPDQSNTQSGQLLKGQLNRDSSSLRNRVIGLFGIALIAWVTLVACAAPGSSHRDSLYKDFKAKKQKYFQDMHKAFCKQSREGKIDILFIGDSITYGWIVQGKEVWEREFAGWKPGNFGIPGDTSIGVLWRITHGEVDGLKPKAIVLMIGTNDLTEGRNGGDVSVRVAMIVSELKKRMPSARVIILGVLPRRTEKDSHREEIQKLNDTIAKLDNGKDIRYVDVGAGLLNEDKTISEAMMPDFLHLSAKGYEVWAARLRPLLQDLAPGAG